MAVLFIMEAVRDFLGLCFFSSGGVSAVGMVRSKQDIWHKCLLEGALKEDGGGEVTSLPSPPLPSPPLPFPPFSPLFGLQLHSLRSKCPVFGEDWTTECEVGYGGRQSW